MTEAARLTAVLADDPSSMTAAAAAGWDHPITFEWAALADLFDAFAQANFKKAKPYPRPWTAPNTRRHGTERRTPEQIRAIFAAHTDAQREVEHG